MEVELKPWDTAEFLHDEQDLALYLEAVLEEDEGPTIYAGSLPVAARARGGVASLARESGIPIMELEAAMQGSEQAALPVLKKLASAYGNLAAGRKVA